MKNSRGMFITAAVLLTGGIIGGMRVVEVAVGGASYKHSDLPGDIEAKNALFLLMIVLFASAFGLLISYRRRTKAIAVRGSTEDALRLIAAVLVVPSVLAILFFLFLIILFSS